VAGETCHVQGEGERLQGLAKASRRLIGFLQERRPQAMATIDVDATILASQKRRALATYDGRTGYQPVVALWAEQDVILADEFRAGNVPAGTGNRRVVEQALAALPAGRSGCASCFSTASARLCAMLARSCSGWSGRRAASSRPMSALMA
jgi:hypothetical protein